MCGMRGRFERWYNAEGGWGAAGMARWRTAGRARGNRAFDEYRDETLRRLEEEEREFRDFLDRLRMARDKAEFDQFMAERRRGDPARSRPARADPGAEAEADPSRPGPYCPGRLDVRVRSTRSRTARRRVSSLLAQSALAFSGSSA